MQKKRILKLILLPTLFGFVIWLGCRKEIPGTGGGKPDGVLGRGDCALFMSFEVETTTMARTVNDADYALLEPIDRIAAMPHRERFAVEACYKNNGDKEVSMIRMTPRAPITYPDNTADGYMAPDYSRVVVLNGLATYYDQFNNVMRTNGHAEDAGAVQNILDMVANRQSLTDAEFNQGLQIMRDSGMMMQEHPNNFVTIRYDFPDGAYSIQALDKTTRVAVGNLHYGANGKLQTRSMLHVEGTPQSPVIKRSFMESFITSMIGNIPMKVEQYATFDNFTFNLN